MLETAPGGLGAVLDDLCLVMAGMINQWRR